MVFLYVYYYKIESFYYKIGFKKWNSYLKYFDFINGGFRMIIVLEFQEHYCKT